MQSDAIKEFYCELDATDEAFVRKKFQHGGYGGWKAKHVKQWLDGKDAQRSEKQAASIALWTKLGAIGTLGAMLIGAVALWHH